MFLLQRKFCSHLYAGGRRVNFWGAEETITEYNLVHCHKHVFSILLISLFVFLHLNADLAYPTSSYLFFLVHNNVTESIISPSNFEIGILFLCSMIVKERKYNSTENRKMKVNTFWNKRECCRYDTGRAGYFCILVGKYFSIFHSRFFLF